MGKAADPVGAEYPKYLAGHDVIAQTAAEEQALLDGRATVEVVLRSAQGDTRGIVPKEAVSAAQGAGWTTVVGITAPQKPKKKKGSR